jgi:acetate kinase
MPQKPSRPPADNPQPTTYNLQPTTCNPQQRVILTVNGGSSSIKFAIFTTVDEPEKLVAGEIQRVGQPGTTLSAEGLGAKADKVPVQSGDHGAAAGELVKWLRGPLGDRKIAAVGHRVVHGGFHLLDHQLITEKVLDRLKAAKQLDLAHLPREISLIESFGQRFPGIPQVACLDTAFFKDLPTLAKILPIPRKYFDAGIHRFGFHGLSYTYLMQELRRICGDAVANGKVILAHIGSGASMAAVKNGKPIDTSMSFTPTAGLMMGTRSGDVDAGVLIHLIRNEKLSADQLNDLVNRQSGLLGVSGTSADMRDLNARAKSDSRAAEAVDLFCYQAKKWIGSFAAALGGVETLIFAGGIGEHGVEARAGICSDLKFLGIEIDEAKNIANEPIISTGPTSVRVIPTNEEIMIARIVMQRCQF